MSTIVISSMNMQRTSQLFRRIILQSRPYSSTSRAVPLIRRTLPRTSSTKRPQFHQPSSLNARYASQLTVPEAHKQKETSRPVAPSYQLTFTCKPCKHRSAHRVTKQGYHHGTVLISCPNCKNRHVISDHLKIFMDDASTLEDILRRTAGTEHDVSKLLKKGRLGQREGQLVGNEAEEDLEFWDDGTTTKHTPA